MKKMFKPFLALALLTASQTALTAEHEVKMLNSNAEGIMVFEPGYLKIAKGDTVNFVATDAGHNAMSEVTPDGSRWEVGFDGGKVTFDKEGAHIYYCLPHKTMAMYGVIQVGDVANKAEVVDKAKAIDAGFAMNHGRLVNYADQIK